MQLEYRYYYREDSRGNPMVYVCAFDHTEFIYGLSATTENDAREKLTEWIKKNKDCYKKESITISI
jgi:hypothetical protein